MKRIYFLSFAILMALTAKAAVYVTKISFSAPYIEMQVGDTVKLEYTVLPDSATNKNVKWETHNMGAIKLDSKGTVIGLKTGTAEVIATASDGKGAEGICLVTVKPQPVVPEAVNLGLSVNWANMNVGAAAITDKGDYFMWGDAGLSPWDFDQSNYVLYKTEKETSVDKDGFSTTTTYKGYTKYVTKKSEGFKEYYDGKTVLDDEDDVAYVTCGKDWHIPSRAQWTELIGKCTWTESSLNGVSGMKVTGPNGNYIFLPAAGYADGDHRTYFTSAMAIMTGEYCPIRSTSMTTAVMYWTNTLYDTTTPITSWGGQLSTMMITRYYGLPVRAVYEPKGDGIEVNTVNAEKHCVGIYALDGKKISSLCHGLYIMRYSDGTSKKVLVK